MARNNGVDAASGEYVVFIDADDIISSSHLSDLFSLSTSLNLDVAMCNGWRFQETPGDMDNHPLVVHPKPRGVMSGVEWFETTFNEGDWCGYAWMSMMRLEFLRRQKICFMEGVYFEDLLWAATVQMKAARVAYTPKQSYYYRLTPGSILNDQSFPRKIGRIYSYIIVIEELWRMAEIEPPRTAELFKRLAAAQGRILLTRIAEIGSLRGRVAISRELQKRDFLARLFCEAEEFWHRKRIVRAYWFAWLGAFAGQAVSTDDPQWPVNASGKISPPAGA